jgi:hypothetical protein
MYQLSVPFHMKLGGGANQNRGGGESLAVNANLTRFKTIPYLIKFMKGPFPPIYCN